MKDSERLYKQWQTWSREVRKRQMRSASVKEIREAQQNVRTTWMGYQMAKKQEGK